MKCLPSEHDGRLDNHVKALKFIINLNKFKNINTGLRK